MDLPKNITQIGEANRSCKIYVEDYVVSYIKQLNGHALDKELAVALYGVRKEEAGITYLFFYGAGKLNFLQRETRHLSQAVLQEAEKTRRKYFGEYEFLGYRLLNGEMVDGFHVYEQGVCRYIEGYAQFYEKNDSMLQFMLSERQEEAKPEEFNQEKYELVKHRQEERRSRAEEQSGHARTNFRGNKYSGRSGEVRLRQMKMTAAAVFVLLCVAGIATMNGGKKFEELQVAARQMIDELTEQQLPDAVEVSNGTVQVGTIVAEDKLTDAIRKENEAAMTPEPSEESGAAVSSEAVSDAEPIPESAAETATTPMPETTSTPTPTQTPEATPTPEPTPTPESTPTPEPEPVSYTVKKGDTLIGICLARYGSDARVAEICSLNNINNPDDIKVGEKILLPQ